MNRNILFSNLLNLHKTSSDIVATAIITKEGQVVTTNFSDKLDENRAGAVSAGIFSLAARAAKATVAGNIKQILIKNKKNNVLITGIGKFGLLVVITKPDALNDLIFFKMQHSSKKLLPLYNAVYYSEFIKLTAIANGE